jgi:hypothetical protein
MNWKQKIFKPKWQNKNADIRLESVSTEQDPALIGSLVEIAATDEDTRVRCAAIKRLHRLENILKLYSGESDAGVRELLEVRIRQLASASNETRPELKFRMQVLEITSDRELIEHLASHAPEPELRRAALAKVERQGVLGDCCINDDDADIRKFAATRIGQHTTLKRVIEGLRKRDKALYSELQARLHKELLAQSDPAAVQTEATNICIALEKLGLTTEKPDKDKIKTLQHAWQGIAKHTSAEMTQRYQRICDRLTAPPPAKVVATPAPEASEPVEEDKTEPAVSEVENSGLAYEPLVKISKDICLYEAENPERPRPAMIKKLRNQLEKTWAQCGRPQAEDEASRNAALKALENMEATLEALHQQSEKDLDQARELLTQLETELEQGELHKALETRAQVQEFAKGHGKHREWQKINSQLAGMQARLRELRDWQHWSNNKVRKRLIAEMEVLPAADLHPDALLDRIKSLQSEWKALEQSEQIPGDKRFMAAPWMWRKFSAAGHAAFDTAKPYLDKRTEIQSRHAQSLATFCAELEQLAQADPPDWTALGKGLNRGRKKLRDLNNVPARQRQKMARKLKSTLDKANAVVQEHYQVVEKEKVKLIRLASQLVHMAERSEAIEQAKSLQSNWKAAGSLWRSREQELWNQFREHLDPLFAELKNEQASIRAADDERLAAQKTLCSDLKEILKNKEDLSAQHGRVQGLQDAWKDIEHPDRRLLQTFQDMVTKYQKLVEKAEQKQIDTDRDRWWLKSALLHELTVTGRTAKGALSKRTESKVGKNWPGESSDDTLESSMDQACKDLMAGESPAVDADAVESMREKARALCIALEFVAGLPSPEEDRERRMKYQVDRLAESMSGDSARKPAVEEAHDTEKTWLAMYALPEADYEQFGSRIKQALTTILES